MFPSKAFPSKAFPSKAHHYQHWYIACTTQALKQKPISRTVLGVPLVLFRGSQNQPVALLDRCPHRNVPLSEGRLHRVPSNKALENKALENKALGTISDHKQHSTVHLTCRYHGWQFNEQGQCQHIPGLCPVANPTSPSQSHESPSESPSENPANRNAIAYPATEQQGFIWVYPSPLSPVTASPPRPTPYAFPYLNHPHFTTTHWQIHAKATLPNAAENFLDATHTHFVHGGLIRNDQQRQPVTVKIIRNQHSAEAIYTGEQQLSGLLYRLLAPGCRELTSIGRFILPAIAQIEYKTDRHYRLLISLFITPTAPQQLTAYCVVTFRWGLLNGLGRLLARPLFYPAMRQDLAILDAQTQNINRFKQEKFTYTELDFLRSHIDYLLDNPAPSPDAANSEGQLPLFETTRSVQL